MFTDRSLSKALLLAKVDTTGEFLKQIQTVDMLGFPVVPNMSAMQQGKPQRMRLEQMRFIGFVLPNSYVKCYIAFLKRLQNSNINEKYAFPVDRKDIKVCFGNEKSKSSNITVQCLYSVFSKSGLLTRDSFR